jgi:hypothetical protein
MDRLMITRLPPASSMAARPIISLRRCRLLQGTAAGARAARLSSQFDKARVVAKLKGARERKRVTIGKKGEGRKKSSTFSSLGGRRRGVAFHDRAATSLVSSILKAQWTLETIAPVSDDPAVNLPLLAG